MGEENRSGKPEILKMVKNPPWAVVCSTSQVPPHYNTTIWQWLSACGFNIRAGHVTLWKEGVCHRDVSHRNMMWSSGQWAHGHGAVHDTRAAWHRASQPRGSTRRSQVSTSLWYESFVWCFAWICSSYKMLLREEVPFPASCPSHRTQTKAYRIFSHTVLWCSSLYTDGLNCRRRPRRWNRISILKILMIF